MDFISWSVIAVLFVLGEFAIGKMYLLAIGLACFYPAIADYMGASAGMQLAVLGLGIMVHTLVVKRMHHARQHTLHMPSNSDRGQCVEIIEWLDDGDARVRYQGAEWFADKLRPEMPNTEYGIIQSVQYGRLIISTEAHSGK